MADHKNSAELEQKSEASDPIGEQLRNQRKARGISLVEVSEHTKIGKKYLEALEEGRYEVMSCEAYIRGFLRAYAKYLELDDNGLIEQYKQRREKNVEKRAEEPVTEEVSRKNNQSIWMPLMAMLILAGIGAGVFLLWPSAQEQKSTPENNAAYSPESNLAAASVALQTAGAATGLTLTIKGKDKTWITLMIDGRQEPDITLNPGEERSWSAQDRFVLWTGNAGGIEVYFNGELQPPLGKPGEVRKEVVFERHAPVSEVLPVQPTPVKP